MVSCSRAFEMSNRGCKCNCRSDECASLIHGRLHGICIVFDACVLKYTIIGLCLFRIVIKINAPMHKSQIRLSLKPLGFSKNVPCKIFLEFYLTIVSF